MLIAMRKKLPPDKKSGCWSLTQADFVKFVSWSGILQHSPIEGLFVGSFVEIYLGARKTAVDCVEGMGHPFE